MNETEKACKYDSLFFLFGGTEDCTQGLEHTRLMF